MTTLSLIQMIRVDVTVFLVRLTLVWMNEGMLENPEYDEAGWESNAYWNDDDYICRVYNDYSLSFRQIAVNLLRDHESDCLGDVPVVFIYYDRHYKGHSNVNPSIDYVGFDSPRA